MSADPPPATGRAPRVTCVISTLSVGGAERVMTALAGRWVAMGWTVTLITFSPPGTTGFHRPDPRVEVRQLGLLGSSGTRLAGLARNIRRLARLRRAIAASRPDSVLSFLDRTNVLTLLATVGQPWPVVVGERSAPEIGPGRGWGLLRRLAYPRAARVVVQTSSATRAFRGFTRVRLAVIPNPVLADEPPPAEAVADAVADDAAGRETRIVALGRLVPAKGFDLLLRAFAGVHARQPDAHLEIWGEGPERQTLERLVAELGLGDVVALPGETRTPAAVLARACVLALPSRHEGFPNVLLEAMALGIPVVAFDCRHGPAEIVRDGVDGLLVPAGDVPGLADGLAGLLADRGRREQLGRRAREVHDRFALERIGPMWDALLMPAAGRAGTPR